MSIMRAHLCVLQVLQWLQEPVRAEIGDQKTRAVPVRLRLLGRLDPRNPNRRSLYRPA